MKKFIITGADRFNRTEDPNTLTSSIEAEGGDSIQVFDGYHTMDEVYEHRIALFMALCKVQDAFCTLGKATGIGVTHSVWKSMKHHPENGAMFVDCFIAGITMQNGEQITYHLPLEKWDAFNVPELEHAPKWDGHTPADVLERLAKL